MLSACLRGATGELGPVGQNLQRGCSFNRRFVRLSGAHCHAKGLTSEHLLLLKALFSGERQREQSCGDGRAHVEGKGGRQRIRVTYELKTQRGLLI